MSGLFTAEFYQAVRKRLLPGGILCQWLPLYEMTEEDLSTALATMSTQFKHFAGWTNGSAAIILASQDPLPLKRATPRQLPDAVAISLQKVSLTPWTIDQYLAEPDIDEAMIAQFRSSAGKLNRDDHPVLEFRSAANLYRLTKPGANPRWAARLRKQRN